MLEKKQDLISTTIKNLEWSCFYFCPVAVSEEEKLPSDLDGISASDLLPNNPSTKEICLRNISIDDIIMLSNLSDRTASMSLNNEKSIPKVQQPAPVKGKY